VAGPAALKRKAERRHNSPSGSLGLESKENLLTIRASHTFGGTTRKDWDRRSEAEGTCLRERKNSCPCKTGGSDPLAAWQWRDQVPTPSSQLDLSRKKGTAKHQSEIGGDSAAFGEAAGLGRGDSTTPRTRKDKAQKGEKGVGGKRLFLKWGTSRKEFKKR